METSISSIIDLNNFNHIELVEKLDKITFIGEKHNKLNEYDSYLFAKHLRTLYKSCMFSCFKTEILIEDYNIKSDLTPFNREETHLTFIANYLAKNHCNVTKCDYRKSFPFYLSIVNKNIKDIVDIIENVSKLIEHIDKKEFPLMMIHRIKQMNNAMDHFSLKNEAPLIRIIRTIINRNINGKPYKRLLIQSFNELRSALIIFQGIKNTKEVDVEIWNILKKAFEQFCDTFSLFFSFILDWVFLYYIEKYKNSNIVVYAGTEHIKSLLNTLRIKENQHKLMKHLDFF
jgi:hypothetical protein